MKSIKDYIDAGILIQSDIDNEYISQKDIDDYNKMSDEELREAFDAGYQLLMDDYHTFFYHQKQLREPKGFEFVSRNGIVELHNQVIMQILEERKENVESTLDDMTNIINLQEHEGDEEYFKEIDEQYARIGTLKAEG